MCHCLFITPLGNPQGSLHSVTWWQLRAVFRKELCVTVEPIHGETDQPREALREDRRLPIHSPVTTSTACSTSVSSADRAQTKVSQHHSEIKGGYSSCWWLIDTQVTGCMSKLPIRATSLKSYIFPQVTIACVFAIFSFKAVPGQSHRYTFGLKYFKLKARKAQLAGYWGLLEVTTGPLNDKVQFQSHPRYQVSQTR